MTARQLAYEALLKTARDGSYSNLTLDALLKAHPMEPRETQFASRLFYGVLERKLTLDYQIELLTRKPVHKLDPEVAASLELGLYQLSYMDGVPSSAAVNESVNLIKKSRKKSAAGFVNGVLRSYIRGGCKVTLPAPKDKYRRAEVEYSIPAWILRYWERDYGFDMAVGLAKACMGRPPLNLRVNTQKTTASKVVEMLKKDGVSVEEHPLIENCLTIEHSGSISKLSGFSEGFFYVQDASSQFCAAALGAQAGERVFDLCAAPGSKSFTVAQLMENKGEICSFDLYEHRVGLIEEGARRLGLSCIQARQGDASQFDERLKAADRVLCDVPCSGLGIIRRKPEIKYKERREVDELPKIQRAILYNGARYVKRGGVLLYSTCSLNKDENERVVEDFLQNHPDFERDSLPDIFTKVAGKPVSELSLSPLVGNFDGFFLARLKRK